METEHNTKYEKTAHYECGHFNKKFTQSRNVFRHLKAFHGCQTYTKCKHCTQIYGDMSLCDKHEIETRGTYAEVSEKIKIKIVQQICKHAIGKIFQSFKIQADNQNDVYNFVREHLEDLKLFLRNKIADLRPLKIQLLVSVQVVKPTDDTKVSCQANSKSKTLATEISEEKVFDFIDQMQFNTNFFQQLEVDSLLRKMITWISTLTNSNLSEVADALRRHPPYWEITLF